MFYSFSESSIGCFGQTSKAMRDILLRWVKSNVMIERLTWSLLTAELSSEVNWGESVPPKLEIELKQTGVLIKRLSNLFPTTNRLAIYNQMLQLVFFKIVFAISK